MITRILLNSGSALFLATAFAAPVAHAVPKSNPCQIYKTNQCLVTSSIPRKTRVAAKSLFRSPRFVSPVQRYPIRNSPILNFPTGDKDPLVLIPAGTETITLCQFVGGKFECTVLTKFKACPTSVDIMDDSGRLYHCDVDCDNRSPSGNADSNGNCDCDIELSSCS